MSTKRAMYQTAQDHATQIARLKTAKEEGDTKQHVLKKQFEAEMERIKTEFTFKVRIILTYVVRFAHPLIAAGTGKQSSKASRLRSRQEDSNGTTFDASASFFANARLATGQGHCWSFNIRVRKSSPPSFW